MKRQIIITFATLIFCFSVTAQTWYPVDAPTNKELRTIQFISDDIGYIGGDSVLLKTIDGGITWNDISADAEFIGILNGIDVYDLHFFSENSGYIMSGIYGAMLETEDGGLTWEGVGVTSGFCQQTSLYFTDENNGFAGGAGCFEGHIIAKYENGTWTQTDDPDDWSGTDYVTTINFKDSNLGFAGTVSGKLLRTTDGGDLWDTIPNPASGFPITDIDFDGDLIRVSHNNQQEFASMISNDDGLTWGFDSELASFFYPEFNALHTAENGLAYAAGRIDNFDEQDGIIFERQGNFWNGVPLEFKINDLDSHSDSIVFAVGDNGAIYTNQMDIANGITERAKRDIIVYPNPIASGSKISIDIPISHGYSFKLINAFGACVLEHNFSEIDSRNIEIGDLSAGTYILQVSSMSGKEYLRAIQVIVTN